MVLSLNSNQVTITFSVFFAKTGVQNGWNSVLNLVLLIYKDDLTLASLNHWTPLAPAKVKLDPH